MLSIIILIESIIRFRYIVRILNQSSLSPTSVDMGF
jgi:hypothetical protein